MDVKAETYIGTLEDTVAALAVDLARETARVRQLEALLTDMRAKWEAAGADGVANAFKDLRSLEEA